MLLLLSTSALLRHLCLQPPSLFLLCLPVPRSAPAASAQDVGHIYACTIPYCSSVLVALGRSAIVIGWGNWWEKRR
ncbi:hypothetical protein BKA57DRAFT_447311 [Linnemannia elongata]|nr:hypothetical protein BKA57DRAFT_447311 [Linnemannia elongata]